MKWLKMRLGGLSLSIGQPGRAISLSCCKGTVASESEPANELWPETTVHGLRVTSPNLTK